MHHILRWHCHPDERLRNSGDTVDRHQQRVMALCHELAARIGLPLVGSDLLKACRHHDEAEKVLGDMPGPAKAQFPDLAVAYAGAEWEVLTSMGLSWNLTAQEQRALDLCDKLDAWLWAAGLGVTGPEWDVAAHRLIVRAERLCAADWLEGKMQEVTP